MWERVWTGRIIYKLHGFEAKLEKSEERGRVLVVSAD
jgi:hypothetical protein